MFLRYMLDINTLVLTTFLSILFFLIFYRKKIITIFDPFLYQSITFSFAFSGFLVVGLNFLNTNFYSLLYIIFAVFILGIFVGNIKTSKINFDINIPKDLQILYLSVLLFIVVSELLINQLIPGHIPLFMGYSSDMRIAATENSRFLYYLAGSVGFLPIIFLALSEYKIVRKIAFFILALAIIKTIFMASKAFLLYLVILYSLYNFLKHLKYINKNDVNAQKEIKKINKAKYKLVLFTSLAIAILPLFFLFVGAGEGLGILLFFNRLYLGLDNMMFVVVYDLKIDEIFKQLDLGLIELYFAPFLKVLTHINFPYSSSSEYIVEQALHMTEKQAIPNSNMILEITMTNGYMMAGIITALVLLFVLHIKKQYISNNKLKLYQIVFFYYFITTPFNLLMFGSQEFVKLFLATLLVVFVTVLYKVLPKKSSKKYK